MLVAGGDLTLVDAADPDAPGARAAACGCPAPRTPRPGATCLVVLDAAGVTTLPLPCDATVPIEPPGRSAARRRAAARGAAPAGRVPNPFQPRHHGPLRAAATGAGGGRGLRPGRTARAHATAQADARGRARRRLGRPRRAGRPQPSGAYVVRITADGRSDARKVQLVR
ncbi:MAG: hypothetical protein IPH09_13290 [bacterium]|nr:hypothetical protein [bacterium]